MAAITLVSTTITIPTNTAVGAFAPGPTGAPTASVGAAQATSGGTLRLALSATPTHAGAAAPIIVDALLEQSDSALGPWRPLGTMQCRAADGYASKASFGGAEAFVRGTVLVAGPTLKSCVVSLAGESV